MAETIAERFVSNEITSLVLTDALMGIGDRVGTPKYGLVQITALETLLQATIAVGKQTLWVPANQMTARTSGPPAVGLSETSTNKIMSETFDFDEAAQEHVQFVIRMPKKWDLGTLTWGFIWSHPTTTINFDVRFDLKAVAFNNSDPLDTPFGSNISLFDTGGTTDDIFISDESNVLTIDGSPIAEEVVVFQLSRIGNDGGDTLAVDARLHGIFIHITTNANTDD